METMIIVITTEPSGLKYVYLADSRDEVQRYVLEQERNGHKTEQHMITSITFSSILLITGQLQHDR